MQQILSGTGVADRRVGASGVLLWSAAGLVLYLLAGVAGLIVTVLVADPILAVIGLPAEAGAPGLSVRNALHPLVWGVLVAGTSAPIGRRLVPGIRFSLEGTIVLVAGLTLATASWLLIQEFVRSRYSYVDVDYVGFSVLTWPALVAIALSGWAALAVPRGAATPLVALLVLAGIGLAVALLPSVIGAADGIDAENIPLALVLLIDVAYAIAVVVLAFRRSAAPTST